MGNRSNGMASPSRQEPSASRRAYEPAETFAFMDSFPEATANGLQLDGVYFPEEVLAMILSYVPPRDVLRMSLVCRKWCNIIKSDSFWIDIYHRRTGKKAKKLPWYVYYCFFATKHFDGNLLKNGNGQDGYKHWTVVVNYGDQFKIENLPCGADPLPPNVPEFNGKTSCFATSYYECNKLQEIQFHDSRLMHLVFDKFKPHIYLSEWVAGRFDCGSIYYLWCKLFRARGRESIKKASRRRGRQTEFDESEDEEPEDNGDNAIFVQEASKTVEQWGGSTWEKVEMVVKDYPVGVRSIVFQHEGRDTQFWKGHYGSKMAGGVVKILFDSIEPLT